MEAKDKISEKELKIGNLVTVDNEKYHPELLSKILKVTGINQVIGLNNERTHSINLEHINQFPNTYYETYSQFIKFIKPIPLTEEWLLRAGYSVTDENTAGKIYHIVKLGEFLNDDIMLILYIKGDNKNCIFRKGKQIKYVHQLQNLYWCLCGEELTFEN